MNLCKPFVHQNIFQFGNSRDFSDSHKFHSFQWYIEKQTSQVVYFIIAARRGDSRRVEIIADSINCWQFCFIYIDYPLVSLFNILYFLQLNSSTELTAAKRKAFRWISCRS